MLFSKEHLQVFGVFLRIIHFNWHPSIIVFSWLFELSIILISLFLLETRNILLNARSRISFSSYISFFLHVLLLLFLVSLRLFTKRISSFWFPWWSFLPNGVFPPLIWLNLLHFILLLFIFYKESPAWFMLLLCPLLIYGHKFEHQFDKVL